MDTSAVHGEFIFNLFGSLAQYERSLARERIMAGLECEKNR
ncbi:MAG: DNA invertase Pin-like site-specific DNA recombinase [Candidatus Deianiraeaceae bacterium]|jgi:DNA invertase Pin-like site-specific DNA recombinase